MSVGEDIVGVEMLEDQNMDDLFKALSADGLKVHITGITQYSFQ